METMEMVGDAGKEMPDDMAGEAFDPLEVRNAREAAEALLSKLQAQLNVYRESTAETQQRHWLRFSRQLMETQEKEMLKAQQEGLRQQREKLEQKIKEAIQLQDLKQMPEAPVTPEIRSEVKKPVPKARGPPPPKPKPKPKALGAKGQPTPPRTNGLVNINWKKKAAPNPEDFRLNDDFLREMAAMSENPMADVELSKHSVFEGTEKVPELTETQLQYWFGLRARPKRPTPCSSRGTSVHSTSRGTSGSNTPAGATASKAPVFSLLRQRLLDERTIRSAGFFLARFRMNHCRNTSASPKALVEEICKAVLQCRVRKDKDGLENLRESFESYVQAKSPITSFVEEQGIEALENCDPEPEHRLLYQVSCIPGIHERLRCFKIQSSWDKDATKCKNDLEVLKSGLQVMRERKEVLRRFFSQAMRLGNNLNKAAGGPIAPHGFRLSSFETFLQTKSPWRPKLSLLHLTLSLLDVQQVLRLAELDKLDLIRAHGLLGKTSGVHERCRELVVSLSKLQQLVAQVDRKCADKEPNQQDTFREHMTTFLDSRRNEAVLLAQSCFDLYTGYKELAIFFGEPDAFYPPPFQSTDGAEDMFLFFHRFGEVVVRAQKEITSMRLREELQAAREDGPEAAARVAEEVAFASGMPLGAVRQRLLPEPVTKADAVLMTPPGSPCRTVRSVASPCRGRGSDKISASARAVERLKQMSATPEADAQSDVSDWEPNSGPRRSQGSTLAPSPPKPQTCTSLGLPRRRLALPRERPACSTPSSSASSPKWHEEQDDGASSSRAHSMRSRVASGDEGPSPGAFNVEVTTFSLPLPSTPTNNRCTSIPRGSEDPPGRKSEMRQRLSLMANRLESKALSQYQSSEEEGLGSGPVSDVDSVQFASCASPCQRSVDTDSTDSTWETARSCCPQPIGPEANASLTAELKREVRKRSASRHEFQTPKNHRMNLSPVGEPGETPYRTQSGSTTGKGASVARSECSAGHQKSPPTARRINFGRCGHRKK